MSADPNAIIVWPYHKAPEELRALSNHGGDEDWLALLPAGYANDIPMWMDDGTAFGRCDVSRHDLPDGCIVCIGAHA